MTGVAVCILDTAPARLEYGVTVDQVWQTRRGFVRGWLRSESIESTIVRTREGAWTLNGNSIPGVRGAVDLDLGFTPATNLLPVRRLALAEGQRAEVPAAWFDIATKSLEPLPQWYERLAKSTYRYQAPSLRFTTLLDVDPVGFVRSYPGLWEKEE